jgi:hypothetical protein
MREKPFRTHSRKRLGVGAALRSVSVCAKEVIFVQVTGSRACFRGPPGFPVESLHRMVRHQAISGSEDLVDPKVDVARLRGLPALSQQKLNEIDPTFQHGHEIAAVREKHHSATRRVNFNAVF